MRRPSAASSLLLVVLAVHLGTATIISAARTRPHFVRSGGSLFSRRPWSGDRQRRIISPVIGVGARGARDWSSRAGSSISFVSPATSNGGIIGRQRRGAPIMAEPAATRSNSDAAASAPVPEAVQLLRRRKQSFRKQIRSRIKATYPPNETAKLSSASDQVFARLADLPVYQAATSVGFFLSMPSGEIQTRKALRQIVDDGKAVFVPRVGLDFEKCDMDMLRCDATATTTATGEGEEEGMFYDEWPRNKWGIPEPPATSTHVAQPGDIDLLLVPGLAFDANGHRLGQGKGYYDRFIAKMRDSPAESADGVNDAKSERRRKPYLLGVCLDEQFLEEVPHGVDLGVADDGRGHIIPVSDHDYIMDMVLTPTRTVEVRRS